VGRMEILANWSRGAHYSQVGSWPVSGPVMIHAGTPFVRQIKNIEQVQRDIEIISQARCNLTPIKMIFWSCPAAWP
jgi:hypothetical protein